MPNDAPPEAPKITKRDRDRFRANLQRALVAKKLSGRALERRIGMATGTLSKLYSGRLALTLGILREVASELAVGPEVLVEGTALVALLTGAPESAESTELLEARGELDQLRGDRAASEATIRGLRKENEALRRDLAVARDAEATARAGAEKAYAELTRATSGASTAMARHGQAEREKERALQKAAELRTALAAQTAKCNEVAHVADGWRRHAIQREQRVHYLEVQLARAHTAAASASAEEAGKLLLASLASLGIGLVIGDASSSDRSRRRPRA